MDSDTAGGSSAPRPTRRTLVRTAAWTAPVLATVAAAPAFAASPCTAQFLDFGAYPAGTDVPSGSSLAVGSTTITMTLSGSTSANDNATIFQTTPSTKELRFYDLNASNTSQTIKLAFSRPVTNLTLVIVDIDQSSNYDDEVVVTTAGYTYTNGSSVTGDGTTKKPFSSSTGTSVPDGSGLAVLNLKYASATQVQFTYRQGGGTITGNPHIGLRSIAFTPSTC